MDLGSYDSPTFLGQRDKYLMGLSLPQLMVAAVVGVFWFLVSLAFGGGMLVRMSVTGTFTLVTLLILFVRLSGLSIPMYVVLSIQRVFVKPSYEDVGALVLEGQPEWLDAKRQRAGRRSRLPFRRKGKRGEVVDRDKVTQRRAELQAEVDKQVVEGATVAEQFIRDGIRMITRG